MNVCFDLLSIPFSASTPARPTLQTTHSLARRPQSCQNSFETQKTERGKAVKNAWNKAEKRRYVGFLKKNKRLFALAPEKRKELKINVLMSQAVRTRSPAKCHSFHQKMIIKYSSVDLILANFAQQLGKKTFAETCIEDEEHPCEEPLSAEREEPENTEPFWLQYLDLTPLEVEQDFVKIEFE